MLVSRLIPAHVPLLRRFLLKAKRLDPSTKKYNMGINFEVCIIDKVDLTGIRLVRVKGDTFAYKKETDRLLKQIQHAL